MNDNQQMTATSLNGGHVPTPSSPVKDPSTVTALLELKNLVLGNARILYGSESRKFFGSFAPLHSHPHILPHLVTARNPAGKHVCVLVCSLDGHTRILRKEMTSTSALDASRALADSLIRDAGELLAIADVGDQLHGQQGFRGESGIFKLDGASGMRRFPGPVDDTATLRFGFRRDGEGVARGAAGDRKRCRREEGPILDY
ncbi:hypothetical protein PMIN04_012491 [Paraphaeosphaeria minitans]